MQLSSFLDSVVMQCLLTLHFLTQSSPEVMEQCHQRAADRIVAGCLANGGLYVKLGQGLGSFNQILPRQYIDTLRVLQDQVSPHT